MQKYGQTLNLPFILEYGMIHKRNKNVIQDLPPK
jgi:hypothetical protein